MLVGGGAFGGRLVLVLVLGERVKYIEETWPLWQLRLL